MNRGLGLVLTLVKEMAFSMTHSLPSAGMAVVRPFTLADAPDAARLFLHVFRSVDAVPSAALIAVFKSSFVNADGSSFSRVYIDSCGKLTGFVGALPQDFVCGERRVSALVVGSLMVRDPVKDPLAGARLLRSLQEAGRDVVVSETANPVSQKMWEKSGGLVIPGYSLDYFRILRPFGFLNALASLKVGALRFLRPFAQGLDGVAARFFRPDPALHNTIYERDLSPQEAGGVMLHLAQHSAVAPDFDALRWQKRIEAAQVKAKYGGCVCRGVFDRKDHCIGLYLFHGEKGKTAQVLQILAHPSHRQRVVALLVAAAYRAGAVAVRGRSVPELQTVLAQHKAVFVQRSVLTLYTQDAAIIDAFQRGSVLTTGLAGETWVGLIGYNDA